MGIEKELGELREGEARVLKRTKMITVRFRSYSTRNAIRDKYVRAGVFAVARGRIRQQNYIRLNVLASSKPKGPPYEAKSESYIALYRNGYYRRGEQTTEVWWHFVCWNILEKVWEVANSHPVSNYDENPYHEFEVIAPEWLNGWANAHKRDVDALPGPSLFARSLEPIHKLLLKLRKLLKFLTSPVPY